MASTDVEPKPSEISDRYGGYALCRGAYDVSIDGATSLTAIDESLPDGIEPWKIPCGPRDGGQRTFVALQLCTEGPQTVTFPAYVRRLQHDLRTLGFKMIRANEATGFFGRVTEWAVREFQIYAGMEQVARLRDHANPALEYVRQLEPVENTRVYDGPVSGELNAETRQCLTHWIENTYRCPVVITARTGRGYADVYDGDTLADGVTADNLWRHDDLQDATPRVFAADFTGYYDIPDEVDDNDIVLNGQRHIVLGDYQVLPFHDDYSGPRSIPPNHTWASAEITPETLVGEDANTISGAALSTFRVIRAVSEVECYGFFDSVNAYDNAFISVGPCHWILGRARNGIVVDGELPGYLSYLQFNNVEAYDRFFSRFGINVSEPWVNPKTGLNDGSMLFSTSQRKYTAGISRRNDMGRRLFRQSLDTELWDAFSNSEEEWNYYKSWSWFYHFAMSGRQPSPYRTEMWTMARIRLRDLLTTPLANVPKDAEWGENPAIGDIFTSERAAAILLRWHIRYPTSMCRRVSGTQVNETIKRAIKETETTLDWIGSPANWTNAHESALINALFDVAEEDGSPSFNSTIQRVNQWPNYAGRSGRNYSLDDNIEAELSMDRGSFQFDDSDLPPAP